jgi:hypothetical protein
LTSTSYQRPDECNRALLAKASVNAAAALEPFAARATKRPSRLTGWRGAPKSDMLFGVGWLDAVFFLFLLLFLLRKYEK